MSKFWMELWAKQWMALWVQLTEMMKTTAGDYEPVMKILKLWVKIYTHHEWEYGTLDYDTKHKIHKVKITSMYRTGANGIYKTYTRSSSSTTIPYLTNPTWTKNWFYTHIYNSRNKFFHKRYIMRHLIFIWILIYSWQAKYVPNSDFNKNLVFMS